MPALRWVQRQGTAGQDKAGAGEGGAGLEGFGKPAYVLCPGG